jgi:hypothetical protein
LVAGKRVLAPGGSAVLARVEDLRYTAKAAGYHGGASLAELTVPIVVLRAVQHPPLKGWADAPPQAPDWWNESRIAADGAKAPAAGAPAPISRPRKNQPSESNAMFELGVVDSPNVGAAPEMLAERLLQADTYVLQSNRAGRGALSDQVVGTIVELLEARGGRAHRDGLAAALKVPPTSFDGTLSALRRLLNVDGYEVISVDTDGQTIVLDLELLREQFGV